MNVARLRAIGARRPTGRTLSQGRWAGLGRTRAAAYAASVQPVLPVHGQFDRSRGPDAGSLSADLSHAPSYRPTFGAFPTWLTSVTRNLLVDHYRRTRRDRITDSIDDAMPQMEEKHSSARSPDKLAQAVELSAQLQALSRLSPELREAVILRDLQSLEYNEIQAVLQVPRGHGKSRINRGRIELAKVLEEMGLRPR